MRATWLLPFLCLLPTALAAPPFVETWDGAAHVRVFLANGATICADEGLSTLLVEREMERATFVVTVRAMCAPALVLRGTLDEHGWSFDDSFGLHSGRFAPTDDGTWDLHALIDTCPPMTLCEFPHGVRIHATYGGPLPLI